MIQYSKKIIQKEFVLYSMTHKNYFCLLFGAYSEYKQKSIK